MKVLDESVTRLKIFRDNLQSELDNRRSEVEVLTESIDKTTKVHELFRQLMDVLVVKQLKAFEMIITEGFQTIFYDQDLHFESEVRPKYNKISIDFFIRQGSENDPLPIRGKPIDTFGGGPTCFASFVLKVMALRKLKKFSFLAMDESLNAVSEDYVEATGHFLQSLAKELGFDFLLVTHKTSFVEHADLAYQSRDDTTPQGRKRLHVKRLT